MDTSRRVGAGLLVTGTACLLLAYGIRAVAILAVESGRTGPSIPREPLYVAAAVVSAVAAIGCALRPLRNGTGPTIRDGIVLTLVATFGHPLVATLADPAFHEVLVADPVGSVAGLGKTVVTTPGAILGNSPGPALAALLAPTILLGVAAGHRERKPIGAALALLAGVGFVVAGTGKSFYAPLAYVLLLSEPNLLGVPGGGWMLALIAPIAGFVSVDAIRHARDDGEERSEDVSG